MYYNDTESCKFIEGYIKDNGKLYRTYIKDGKIYIERKDEVKR